MKNTVKIILVAVCIFTMTTACIKQIDPQQSVVTSEQASTAPGAYDNFVNSITNSLCGSFYYSGSNERPWDYGYPSFYLMRDVMGQDIVIEDSSSEWYSTWYLSDTGLGPRYASCQLPWTYFYGWIKNCNTVISLYNALPEGSKEMTNYKSGAGIAYTMRAMFYEDLAQMFAQKTYTIDTTAITVPIISETTTAAQATDNPRATNAKMWKFIVDDLDKAEGLIADYKRADKYTPDLSVVYGLKARAYLIMGEWAKAADYAKKAQSGYSVLTEADIKDRINGFNTPNQSWMFGMTFKSSDPNITNNDGDSSWGSQMIIEVAPSQCGYAASYGTPKRIDAHLYSTIPETDYRRGWWIDFAVDGMSVEEGNAKMKAETTDIPEYIRAVTINKATSKVLGGIEFKFRPKGGPTADQYAGFTVAVPIMRVEEMKLIEIEATGRQSESSGKTLLEQFAKTRNPEWTYGSEPFLEQVWWQRRIELWGEGLATYDIKRLNKGIIRSYKGTNHFEGARWNTTTPPQWMNFCIVETEGDYNSALVNNPTPIAPSEDSPEYQW